MSSLQTCTSYIFDVGYHLLLDSSINKTVNPFLKEKMRAEWLIVTTVSHATPHAHILQVMRR